MSTHNKTKQQRISAALSRPDAGWEQVLSEIISAFDCTAGTIHFLNKKTNLLELRAHQEIPEFLLPRLKEIPIGKGMAGIAAERHEAVELCNLQTDDSGVARPAAKETKVEGSIAVPMLLDGELYGSFGVAKPVPYDFTQEEENDLLAIGGEISKYVQANPEKAFKD